MASQSELSLHTQHTRISTKTLSQYDGHAEGHLNCVGLRHGWRRKFSISPPEVEMLSYAHLEAVLELPTLRLRSSHLRIFVENPPDSGTFSKVRFWKDDGSLQSVLVKEFFAHRMQDGIVTVLDVRDGNDRDDTLSIRSGFTGSMGAGMGKVGRSAGQTKEWIKEKRRAVSRMASTSGSRGGQTPGPADDDDDDDEHDESLPPTPAPAPSTSRFGALMYAIGLKSEAPLPPPPPPKTEAQLLAEKKEEEDNLRKRGWMPPIIRRITKKSTGQRSNRSLRSRLDEANPFFSPSERNLLRNKKSKSGEDEHIGGDIAGSSTAVNDTATGTIKGKSTSVGFGLGGLSLSRKKTNASGTANGKFVEDIGDGEEDAEAMEEFSIVEGDDDMEASNGVQGKDKKKWRRLLGSRDHLPAEKPDKGKGKAFTGAQVVSQPKDAFPNTSFEDGTRSVRASGEGSRSGSAAGSID